MSVQICLFRHVDGEGTPYYMGASENNPPIILDSTSVIFATQKKTKKGDPYISLSIVARREKKAPAESEPDPEPDPEEVPF